MMQPAISIDCSACKTAKCMVPTKISRFSQVLVLIGWLIAIPSILGVLMSGCTMVTMIVAGGAAISDPKVAHSSAASAGAAIGTGIGVGIAVFFGIASLIGGTVGYVLIMKKKVFRCGRCGFIMDRH